MDAVPKTAFKTITIQKGHEELEVFLLSIVGRCGHEEEMAREF